MSFNNDKEIGTKLALLVTPLAIEQTKQIEKDFLSNRQFSEIEAFRYRFCIMILNLVTAMWCINVLESNTKRAKRIIDSMVETFIGAFERNQEPIKIGNLIVDSSEIALIDNKMGQIGISKETMTSYRTIMTIIYNKRITEYEHAFEEVEVVLQKEGKSGFSPSLFRSVAKYFVRHFTGDPWEKHTDFVTDLSLSLIYWYMAIHDIGKEVLGGVKPKVKQESGAGSKFKNREEYETWKAHKIKENEEKRQSQKEIDIGKEPNQLKDAEKKTILLVDDDIHIHRLIDKEFLFRDKMDLVHFYSPKDAFNYLLTNKVHLVISCLRSPDPDINGIHFLRACKELCPKLPFIIHSGMDYRDDFSVWAADAYIIKSSDLSELFKTIEKLLGLSLSVFKELDTKEWGTKEDAIEKGLRRLFNKR